MPLRDVGDALREYRAGSLHSGKGGPVVKDRKQAIAIGLSEQRRAQGKKPARKPARSMSR